MTIKRALGRGLQTSLFCMVLLGGLILEAPLVSASDNCIQDVWKSHDNKQKLTCTANDVRVAFADNVRDLDGNTLTQCLSGG